MILTTATNAFINTSLAEVKIVVIADAAMIVPINIGNLFTADATEKPGGLVERHIEEVCELPSRPKGPDSSILIFLSCGG